MEQLDGLVTYDGAARLLGCSYWQVVHYVKKQKIPTVRLAGSKAVLIKLADLAELEHKK
jgi:excisionase family DNA binding protein